MVNSRIVLFVLTLISGFHALPQSKQKDLNFEVHGVGSARVIHDIVGEPVGQPERLQVFLKCYSKKEIRYRVYRMCLWEGHEFDSDSKTLILKLARGRVNPKTGVVNCDLIDMEEIDFKIACISK